MKKPPILLTIVADGLGYPLKNPSTDTRIKSAVRPDTCPNIFRLIKQGVSTMLGASGEEAALEEGQMGGSEGGHVTIGSGIPDALGASAIVRSFETGAFEESAPVASSLQELKQTGKTMHLLGVLSDGGVHSNLDDIVKTAKIYADQGINVNVHGFADGRDVAPNSVTKYLDQFYEATKGHNNITLATLNGRVDLDRAGKLDVTTKLVSNLMAEPEVTYTDGYVAAEDFYINAKLQSDDVVPDENMGFYPLKGHTGIKEGDGVLLCHHRPDRMQQIAAVLTGNYESYENKPVNPLKIPELGTVASFIPLGKVPDLRFVTDIPYPEHTVTSLYIGIGQKVLKVSETQKGAHVCVFYNGGDIKKYDSEDQIIIESDKGNFDQAPAMKAREITAEVIKGLKSGEYGHIFVNYPNPDMVGHTGNLEATEEALRVVDVQIAEILKVIAELDQEVILVFTADHGNAETMSIDGEMVTSHSIGPVPCTFYNEQLHGPFDFEAKPEYLTPEELDYDPKSSIASIAPTSLAIMRQFGVNINTPEEMWPPLDKVLNGFQCVNTTSNDMLVY